MSYEQLLSLVEYSAYKVGCTYINDLPRLTPARRKKLADILEKVPADVYPLSQWNDALQYIVKDTAKSTAEEAREALLCSLREGMTD